MQPIGAVSGETSTGILSAAGRELVMGKFSQRVRPRQPVARSSTERVSYTGLGSCSHLLPREAYSIPHPDRRSYVGPRALFCPVPLWMIRGDYS